MQTRIAWKAIPVAAFVGGIVMLLVNLLLTPIAYEVNGSVFLRYCAGLIAGKDAVTDTSTGVLALGLLVHAVCSLLFATIISIVVHRWGITVGILGGAILGAALYGINLYSMTVFFEWFFAIHSTVFLLSHILFGAVVGGVYESLDRYDLPLVKERRYETT